MAMLKDLLVMGPGRIIGDAFFGGKLIPTVTQTQDIGSETIKWNNIYGNLKGNADTATEFSSNATVTLSGDVSGTSSGSKKSWSITTSIGTGKVTNAMLAGSIANNKLSNSSITIGSKEISLGSSATVAEIGAAAASHSHGNITNAGELTTASYAVVTDANKKITVTSLAVTDNTTVGTTATKFVAKVTQSDQGKITVTKADLPTSSTSTAGIVQLTNSYTSTNESYATTGKALLAAIQTLDSAEVGGATGNYVSKIKEVDGIITATISTTSVSNEWVAGTTNGPQIKTTVNGITGTAVAIPSAASNASGIVTTGAQGFGGHKTFNDAITVTGVATFNGNVALNSSTSADSLTAGSLVVSGNTSLVNTTTTSNILPNENNAKNIGSSSMKYANIYATTFNGALSGNVTGNVTGNLTGNVTGNVTGNLYGTADYATTVRAILSNTEKLYVLGTTTTLSSTGQNVSVKGDSGVYMTSTAGALSAVRHYWNVSGTEKAYASWNEGTKSIDFYFV